MRISRLLSVAVLIAVVSSGAAQTVIPVEQFRSVELQSGGNVIVRHGKTQRVTMLEGSLRYSRVRLAAGQRLVIDKCVEKCPRHYQMQIEVITPEIAAVSVSNGGTLQSRGAFPAQAAIEAAVAQGGTIDIRSIHADAVEASVDSGGRIYTHPRKTLAATVVSGGIVTYWGNARVEKSIRDGGVVARGTAADAGKPLSELNPPLFVVPPIAPVPPIPPLRNGGR
jgi:hypothetical protein